MINYILLAITIVCTIFNIWLTLKDREGYDKGLEDGIRMTNEVIEENREDEPRPELCRECEDYAGDGMYCVKNHIVYEFSTSADNCKLKDKPLTNFEDKPYLYRDMDGYLCEEEDLDVPFLEIGNNDSQTDCPWR